jgi:hypothetical protein
MINTSSFQEYKRAFQAFFSSIITTEIRKFARYFVPKILGVTPTGIGTAEINHQLWHSLGTTTTNWILFVFGSDVEYPVLSNQAKTHIFEFHTQFES